MSPMKAETPPKSNYKLDDKMREKLVKVVDDIFEATKDDRDEMRRNLRKFLGKFWDEKKLDELDEQTGTRNSRAFINIYFSTIESVAPLYSDNKPTAAVIPRQAFLEECARNYTNAIKYLWDATDMQMTLHKATLDAMIKKIAILEIGFDPEDEFGGSITTDVVDPMNFFLAPGYDDVWKSPFCGVREELPLSWIRKNFPDIKDINPSKHITDNKQSNEGASKRESFKYGEAEEFELENWFISVYRVWMRDESGMEILQDSGEKKTVKKFPYGKMVYFTPEQSLGVKPCLDIDGLPPFITFVNYLLPHNFLGIDELLPIDSLVQELNIQFRYAMDHTRRAHHPNKFLDTASVTDHENVRDNFDKGGQTFAYDSTDSKVPVFFADQPRLDSTVKEMMAYISSQIEEVSGITDTAKGQIGKKERQSASELQILLETSHVRTRQRVRNMEWGIKRLIYLWVRKMQQNYTEPRDVYWTEDDGTHYQVFASTKAQILSYLESAMEGGMPGFEKYQAAQKAGEEKKTIDPDQITSFENYARFLESYGELDDLDPILFDFSIEIQTDSSLPVDAQSRANLAMKLFQLKGIDRESLLEAVKWPRYQEVLERIKQEMASAAQAKGAKP